jgi:FkbM family methyltransferase
MAASRWRYYLSSIPTLLRGVRNWPLLPALLFRWPLREPVLEVRALGGLRFRVRSFMDAWIIKETCLDRDYERLGASLQPDWTVVDIGAGLGDFTVYAARRCPRGMVHAYEPFPGSFALLQENLRLNGLSNVRAFPNAVGGAGAGPLSLYTTGAAVQHRTAGAAAAEPAIVVDSVTLAAVLAELPRCDLLKLDVEGAEYEILFTAEAAALAKVRRLSLEVHDGVTAHTRADLARFLQERGFHVDVRPNPVHADLGFLYAARQEAG